MKICINSRDLSDVQRHRIENYFQDNFSFDHKSPKLVWQKDDSDFILLGFPKGGETCDESSIIAVAARSAPVTMFRVHEDALLRIAGRTSVDWTTSCGPDLGHA